MKRLCRIEDGILMKNNMIQDGKLPVSVLQEYAGEEWADKALAQKFIQQALSEGKPVPTSVLQEYPELKRI